jgi:hypothetical protein
MEFTVTSYSLDIPHKAPRYAFSLYTENTIPYLNENIPNSTSELTISVTVGANPVSGQSFSNECCVFPVYILLGVRRKQTRNSKVQ